MTENTTTTELVDNTSSRGAQWAGAGSLIALAAGSLLNGGSIGNLLGGGTTAANQASTIQNLMIENAILKADASTDQKLVDVYTELRSQDKSQDATVAAIDKRLTALETTVPLREQIVTDKVDSVAQAATMGIAANSQAILNLKTTVGSITKLVVPNSACCPGWGSVTITPSTSGVIY